MSEKYSTNKINKGIYVETKPVSFTNTKEGKLIAPQRYKDAQHLYLIYMDGKGNSRIIRGGPEEDAAITNTATGGGSRIEIQKDIPLEMSYDAFEDYSSPETRNSRKLDIPEEKLDEYWEKFLNTANKIEYSNLKYHNPLLNKKAIVQNSNSTVRTILEENGVDWEKAIPEEVRQKVPGAETNLFKSRIKMPDYEYRQDVPQLFDKDDPMIKQRLEYQEKVNRMRELEKEKEKANIKPEKPTLTNLLEESLNNKKEELPFVSKNDLEKLATSPEHQEKAKMILDDFTKYNNPIEDICYKDVTEITKEELDEAVGKTFLPGSADQKLREDINKASKNWYDYVFGEDPVRHDETGKALPAQPKRQIPQTPIQLKTKDNLPISKAFEEVAKKTSQKGVKQLQQGLNTFGLDPKLKVDDFLGAKTTSRTKESLVKFGLDEVTKRLENESLEDIGEKVIMKTEVDQGKELQDNVKPERETNRQAGAMII